MYNSFKDKIVVVTGGTGFIGRNLIASLLKNGAHVVSISRSLRNMRSYKFTSIYRDLRDTSLREILIHDHINPDYIIHLAGATGGIHYLKQHEAKILTNNLLTISNSFKDIELFKNLKGNLFVSSVCAYPQELQTDAQNCILSDFKAVDEIHNPDSTYGWSKIMGEMLIGKYFKEFNVPGVSIRLFNVYGPYENLDVSKTHVIPSLIIKALKYPDILCPFEVLGDGAQARAFLYIDDAIEAIKSAVVNVTDGDIINIGSSKLYTIKDIVEQIIKISKKNIEPVYTGSAIGAKARLPELIKAQVKLKWAETTSLDEGLLKTYKWIEENL